MVTPFAHDGSLDVGKAQELARYLVDEQSNDGLVISGTTGEAPTTTDQEKSALVRAVVEAVGDRAQVVAGVGTFSTEHTIALARAAEEAGASGLLVVTPYYSKPPQRGVQAHFLTVADSCGLPIMLYDIPHRAGTAIAPETMLAVAEHPRIVAVKDAKGDLLASSYVMANSELAFYSGEDALTLSLMAVGAVGLVGTSTHFTGQVVARMIDAFAGGDPVTALRLHRQLSPLFTGIFATQGCILVKAGLELRGRSVGGLREPLPAATADEVKALQAAMTAAGV